MHIELTKFKGKLRQEFNLDLVESFEETKGSNTTVVHLKDSMVIVDESIDEIKRRIEEQKLQELSEKIFHAFICSGISQSSNYLADRSVNYAKELLNQFKNKNDTSTPDEEKEALNNDV